MNQIRLAYSKPPGLRDDEKRTTHLSMLPKRSPLKSNGSLEVKITLLLIEQPALAAFVETLVDELLKD